MPDVQDLLTRSLESLSWMITDIKYRFDVDMGDVDMGGEGGYSPELKKAIELRTELEEYLLQGSNNDATEATEICKP